MITILLLASRLLSSALLTRRLLSYFAARAASISADLVLKLLSKSLTDIQKRTIQEITFAVTRGVEMITMQILAGLILLVADLFLLLLLITSLLMVSWQVTLLSTWSRSNFSSSFPKCSGQGNRKRHHYVFN
jgi:hypothetical protein